MSNDIPIRPDDLIRVFIAIAIDEQARRLLATVQDELKKSGCRVGWVPPENIHLSLAFLGDVSGEQIVSLSQDLQALAPAMAPFKFSSSGVGYFGSERHPRVIWAGIAGPPPELVKLHSEITAILKKHNLASDDRPFKPHLTFGRIRSAQRIESLMKAIHAARDSAFGTVVADRFFLMRSELHPRGAQYTVLREYKLEGDK